MRSVDGLDRIGSSALGLSMGSGASGTAGPSAMSEASPASARGPLSASSDNYKSQFLSGNKRDSGSAKNADNYAVFESEDGESIGGSTRSTGRGPGMRFSFSNTDFRQPLTPITNSYFTSRPQAELTHSSSGQSSPQSARSSGPSSRTDGGTGFALAGMDFNKRKKTNPASDLQDDSGTRTPRAT